MHQTLEQKRAEYAWSCAREAQGQGQQWLKEYVGLVKKLPALITTNGLGQTLAFLAAKAKTKDGALRRDKPEGLLYLHLEGWLTRPDSPRGPYAEAPAGEGEEAPATRLLFRITRGDSATYRWATSEALALIAWLKSLAEALQEEEEAP